MSPDFKTLTAKRAYAQLAETEPSEQELNRAATILSGMEEFFCDPQKRVAKEILAENPDHPFFALVQARPFDASYMRAEVKAREAGLNEGQIGKIWDQLDALWEQKFPTLTKAAMFYGQADIETTAYLISDVWRDFDIIERRAIAAAKSQIAANTGPK